MGRSQHSSEVVVVTVTYAVQVGEYEVVLLGHFQTLVTQVACNVVRPSKISSQEWLLGQNMKKRKKCASVDGVQSPPPVTRMS